ncbi:MAG: YadA-like family protein [Lonepinella koalarum]|nr:YadA-like family protein [Lonepinella koalarum]
MNTTKPKFRFNPFSINSATALLLSLGLCASYGSAFAATTQAVTTNIGDVHMLPSTEGVGLGSNATTSHRDNVAIGVDSIAEGWRATAVGNEAKAKFESATAIGNQSLSTGWGTTAIGTIAQAHGTNSTAVGNAAETQGAFGAAFGTTARAGGIYSTALGTLSTASGHVSIASGLNTKAVGHSAIAIGGMSEVNGTYSAAVGRENRVDGNHSAAVGYKNTITGTARDTFVVGRNVTADMNNSIYLGSGSTAVASGKNVESDGVTQGTTDTGGNGTVSSVQVDGENKGNFAGSSAGGVLSIGAANNERRIVNVAAGIVTESSTDAVNGSQLYWAVDFFHNRVKALEHNVGSATGTNSVATGNSSTASGNNSTADGQGATASGNNSTAVGQGSTASGDSSTTVGQGSTASGNGSTAVGQGAQASADNAVAIGKDSVADRNNSVSVGSVGRERVITNVGRGTRDTDAANVGQVRELIGGTTNRIVALETKVEKENRKMRAGIAGATAVASLPQAVTSGRGMFSAAVGSHNGQNALAVGYSQVSDNNKAVFKVNASVSQGGGYNAGAGVGYQW